MLQVNLYAVGVKRFFTTLLLFCLIPTTALAKKEPVAGIGQIAADLMEPISIHIRFWVAHLLL